METQDKFALQNEQRVACLKKNVYESLIKLIELQGELPDIQKRLSIERNRLKSFRVAIYKGVAKLPYQILIVQAKNERLAKENARVLKIEKEIRSVGHRIVGFDVVEWDDTPLEC